MEVRGKELSRMGTDACRVETCTKTYPRSRELDERAWRGKIQLDQPAKEKEE